MKTPNVEETIRILFWAVAGGLIAVGAAPVWLVALVSDPTVVGAIIAAVALVWRLARGATQDQ